MAKLKENDIGHATYVGEEMRRYLGDRLYVIATIVHSGEYTADIEPALYGHSADFATLATLAPSAPGTLEATLHERGMTYAFADLRPFRGQTSTVRSRVLDYSVSPDFALRLWDGYDGLLYLDRTHGLSTRTTRKTTAKR